VLLWPRLLEQSLLRAYNQRAMVTAPRKRPGKRLSSRAAARTAPPRPDPSRHARALGLSSELTQIFRRMYKAAAAMITPANVIRLLNRAKVKFILMGTHGIGGWRDEPRATQDVDVLVRKRDHKKAVKACQSAYPDLIVQDLPAVTRFLDPLDQKPVIDLMKPEEDLYQEAFKNPVRVGRSHCVPNLEVALACKYAAMISPRRESEKKHLDAADFISMVKADHEEIARDVLFSLGEMVKTGGGTEIQRLIKKARAGQPLGFPRA
jgi:hypothetical protein